MATKLFLVLSVVFSLILMGCSKKTENEVNTNDTSAIPVEVMEVSAQIVDDTFSLPAYAEAWETVEMNALASGDITGLYVREGERIKKGKLLARLDAAEAQAGFDYAKKALENAENNFDRTKSLYESGFASLQQYEEAEGIYRSALSNYTRGQSSVDRTRFISPINGYVDRIYVEDGEHLSAGRPAIKIVNTSRMTAVVGLPEKDVRSIRMGDRVNIELATFEEPVNYIGTVTSVSYTADPLSRSYRCVVEIKNPRDLRPGMVLKVIFTRKRYENAYLVPLYSLIVGDDGYSLFTVKDGKASLVRPDVGAIIGESILVKTGLDSGDLLVVRGQQYLSTGIDVSIES